MDSENYVHPRLTKSLWDLEPGLVINDRSNAEIVAALDHVDDRVYQPCEEAGQPLKAPVGRIQLVKDFESRIYEGTRRELWIYQPPEKATAPGLAVFQDGYGYLDPVGPVRASAVFDRLISTGQLAPMVAIFISPGRCIDVDRNESSIANQRQRSIEYDTCDGKYLAFLVNEILPLVEEKVGRVSPDPDKRLIGGISSGGICAFNAAWHGPEIFGRVLSHCGSFTNIRGGHHYPYLVRTTPRKPIRVLLQSGEQDANILYGNWSLANQQMASALEFAGYEYKFEYGQGGHSLRHGGSVFADSLKWLMRE